MAYLSLLARQLEMLYDYGMRAESDGGKWLDKIGVIDPFKNSPQPESSQAELATQPEELATQPEIDEVLLDVVRIHNEAQDEMGRPPNKKKLEPGCKLEIGSDHKGHELWLRINARTGGVLGGVSLGYFSPADNAFVLYPEYFDSVDEEYIEQIQDTAKESRLDAMARYRDPILARTDYSHPEVQAIHRDHHDFFELNYNYLPSILEPYNEKSRGAADVHSDKASRAAIFLKRTYVQGRQEYTYLGVRILGLFNRIEENNVRIANAVNIDIATRRLENGEMTDYETLEGYYDLSYDLDEFIEQTKPVKKLVERTDLPGKFDSHSLGIEIVSLKPQAE